MMKMLLNRLWHEDNGQAMVEYALLAMLVAIVSWQALDALSAALRAAYIRWIQAEVDSSPMPACTGC
jgi:Flp pilus assembly pilin Flp